MLKTKSVAKLIQDTLNKQSTEEQFRVVYEYGSYKGTEINAIIKQGKGTITPIMNYTTSTNPFFVEFVVPTRCGEDRIDGIVEIINGMIDELNGKIKPVGNGRCMFAFNPLEIGGLETRATAGQSVLIKLEFNIEYSETSGKADEVVYEMALLNSPFFERDGVNTRYFSDKNTQTNWYLTKVDEEGVGFTKTFTPINQGVITQQIVYINENEVDNNEITNKNCAIIREIKNNQHVNYFYYRIENATINMFNQVLFELKLDTIQTYLLDVKINECLIKRTHLDRFYIDDDINLVPASFDNMLQPETVNNYPKRVVERQNIILKYTDQRELDLWLNDNIAYWVYVFVDKTQPYKVYALDGSSSLVETNFISISQVAYLYNKSNKEFVEKSDFGAISYPVYKTDKRLLIIDKTENVNSLLDEDGLIDFEKARTSNSVTVADYRGYTGFRRENGNTSYFYNLKYSTVCPFYDLYDKGVGWNIDKYGNLYLFGTKNVEISTGEDSQKPVMTVLSGDALSLEVDKTGFIKTDSYPIELFKWAGVFANIHQKAGDIESYPINTNCAMLKYSPSEIRNRADTEKYYSKLYSENYKEMRIFVYGRETFVYDLQKLGVVDGKDNQLIFLYSEPIQPEITKFYLRVKGEKGYYNEINNINFEGLVGSEDTSIAFANGQYSQFLANNKNFWLQTNMNIYESAGTNLLSSAISAAQGNYISAITGVVGGAMSYGSQQTNRLITIDNLQSSPGTLKNANGNVLFNTFINNSLRCYVEFYETYSDDVLKDFEKMRLFGFSFEKYDDINTFIDTRKSFNYIEAEPNVIIADISNNCKQDIVERFKNGIRFWHQDKIDFNASNYETFIDTL